MTQKPPHHRSSFNIVPEIDLEPLLSNAVNGIEHVAAQIFQAYTTVGFAYITNHQIPQLLIDNIFAASADFHALSREEKLSIEVNTYHRGFIPINTSTARTSSIAKATKPNQSESFMMMHELPEDDPDIAAGAPLAGPNQWPRSLPEFRPAVRAYNEALVGLSRKLLSCVCASLGAAPNALDEYFRRPTTFLRLLYYPSQPPQGPADLFGSAPHTDYGFITILLQDNVGGLQVQNISGGWIDAPFRPGAFVMNVGDILHRWSNGLFISTPHRVINKSGRARFSNPFFFDPDMHAEISPLPSCVSAENPSRYEPLIYGNYLMGQLAQNHDQHEKRKG